MEEQRDVNKRGLIFFGVLSIALSFMFSGMSLLSLFYTVPLLLFVPAVKKTGNAVSIMIGATVLIIGLCLFDFRDYLGKDDSGIILFILYFQFVSSLGAIVWTALRDFSDSVLRKLVICSFPIAAIGLGYSIFLSLPSSVSHTEAIRTIVIQAFSVEGLGIDAQAFAEMFMEVLTLIFVPTGMIYSALPILISEMIMKKHDERWQFEFANMKMPDYYVWIFMAAWLGVIASTTVVLPRIIVIVCWNIAFGLSLHYYIGGLSILVARLRKSSANVTASRVFIPVLILSILPGINMVVIAGLTIAGALETWIKLR